MIIFPGAFPSGSGIYGLSAQFLAVPALPLLREKEVERDTRGYPGYPFFSIVDIPMSGYAGQVPMIPVTSATRATSQDRGAATMFSANPARNAGHTPGTGSSHALLTGSTVLIGFSYFA